ncbi:MAG: tRNA (adenosine(37)-N6)-dimethylallyltransferase MiaA [Candidatus Berkelbacteria bacterium]|nr:tRNA (adenosine(37)-N6)-dimethylallyltransferase MiaA [Candidatus Berkelbacteria bacterium]
MKSQRKIICIVGPTASGKTGWGVEIAKKFNGEIVSADSRQVYRKLDIGTGKDLKEYGEIKYHLINICEPEENFTMFDWLTEAKKIVEDIFARGKVPIIVGGTGLYVQGLCEGFQIQKSPQGQLSQEKIKNQNDKSKVKNYSRQELDKMSLEELQRICLQLTAYDLQLDKNNPRRLIRAIERAQSGEIVTKVKPDFEALQIGVELPRDILYSRIDKRVESRFDDGMLEEVVGLIDSGVDPKWLTSLGLEYGIIGNFVIENSLPAGSAEARKIKNCKMENSPEFLKMKQQLKFAIHAYARRQLTWFRRFPEIVWRRDFKSAEKEIKKFLL